MDGRTLSIDSKDFNENTKCRDKFLRKIYLNSIVRENKKYKTLENVHEKIAEKITV